MTCTIFENIYNYSNPVYKTVDVALERIRSGRSAARVEAIRTALDKEKADALKRELPCVCFSGKFESRYDNKLIEHSGFIVLDFDEVEDLGELAAQVQAKEYVYAIWVSPRGTGLKVLVKIADGKKHRDHFAALKAVFPAIDPSGVNESRVCYESYDPNIYINKDATPFTQVMGFEKVAERVVVDDEKQVFTKLLKWITNKGAAFQTGERNSFIFKLASACCRFGIDEMAAINLIGGEFPTSNDFARKEFIAAIKSGYRANKGKAGSAIFDREVLVERHSRKEVDITHDIYDLSQAPKDVIYGSHVKADAMDILANGYPSVNGIGVPDLDNLFKKKRGDATVLTGLGNAGKSTFFKWMDLMRVLLYDEKFAVFSPEDIAAEFYHDYVEMLLGCACEPRNPYKPVPEVYSNAYDFVSSHIFFIYPKELSPTPVYIKERFLELIIKEKVDGVRIDPFNQLTHDYSTTGGRTDKYLETILGDFARFGKANNIYLDIVEHPNKMMKDETKNYQCPDIFDLAGGAMWNNKMDNIGVYHRPFGQTDPTNPTCEFHTKKIRRQKSVGMKGFITFEYKRKTRRYEFGGHDYMSDLLRINELSFNKPVLNYQPKPLQQPVNDNPNTGITRPGFGNWKPYIED